ncbi:MAG: glycoside hydrolase family 32 protein [Bryobacteraceae bacterium]
MAAFRISCAIVVAAAMLQGAEAPKRLNTGPWRLQYHFTPPQNWTNDPNGLVYYEGEYHLFYQFNPFGDRWGHMSWGHAVSRDLLHWRDLPVALAEENGIMIFSGSAVVDEHNSSGFCTPKGSDLSCLVAIYTGHTSERQTQNIAFSDDRGRTWTKYKGNPVIDLHLKDFRDPKVFWYEPERKWVMVCSLPDQHKVRFFASHDLIHWNGLSDFGPAGATGGVWECPDLFELPVEGDRGSRWVLIVNINPGGVAGGSGTQYFVGKFDGRAFTKEASDSEALWMDYGKDYYAAVSYFGNRPGDNRRIMIGWFSNWQYANDTPEKGWRGAMAIPREVSLYRSADGIRVEQTPVRELASLRRPLQSNATGREIAEGKQLEIEITYAKNASGRFGLRVFQGTSNFTEIGIDRSKPALYIDRSHSGIVNFSKFFAGRQEAPLPAGEPVKLDILLDRSSVEVFADDGKVTMADRAYPSDADQHVRLFSGGVEPTIESLRVWRIESVWK